MADTAERADVPNIFASLALDWIIAGDGALKICGSMSVAHLRSTAFFALPCFANSRLGSARAALAGKTREQLPFTIQRTDVALLCFKKL